MNMETLQKAQVVATIASLVAIPVLIAWGSQSIQSRISEEGMRKDYVTMAVGILTKSKEEQPDIELRQWAVKVIDLNSPVPLPGSLQQKLSVGATRLAIEARMEEMTSEWLAPEPTANDCARWRKMAAKERADFAAQFGMSGIQIAIRCTN
jgi:hypothetical protein